LDNEMQRTPQVEFPDQWGSSSLTIKSLNLSKNIDVQFDELNVSGSTTTLWTTRAICGDTFLQHLQSWPLILILSQWNQ
jgi:hypothetical protein